MCPVDVCDRSVTIAMHRKLCSGCRRSFTLLTKGVNAFKSHSEGAVLEAIRSFIEHGALKCNGLLYAFFNTIPEIFD